MYRAALHGFCFSALFRTTLLLFGFALSGDLGVKLRQKLFAEIGDDSRIAVIVILRDAIRAGLGCAGSDFRGLLKAFLQSFTEFAHVVNPISVSVTVSFS